MKRITIYGIDSYVDDNNHVKYCVIQDSNRSYVTRHFCRKSKYGGYDIDTHSTPRAIRSAMKNGTMSIM